MYALQSGLKLDDSVKKLLSKKFGRDCTPLKIQALIRSLRSNGYSANASFAPTVHRMLSAEQAEQLMRLARPLLLKTAAAAHLTEPVSDVDADADAAATKSDSSSQLKSKLVDIYSRRSGGVLDLTLFDALQKLGLIDKARSLVRESVKSHESAAALATFDTLYPGSSMPSTIFVQLYQKGSKRHGVNEHRDEVCYRSVVLSLSGDSDAEQCLRIKVSNGVVGQRSVDTAFSCEPGMGVLFPRSAHYVPAGLRTADRVTLSFFW
jgi:hypothetical protein